MTVTSTRLHLPAGTAGDPPADLVVTPESAGWAYSGLAVLSLAAGETVRLVDRGAPRPWCCRSQGSCTRHPRRRDPRRSAGRERRLQRADRLRLRAPRRRDHDRQQRAVAASRCPSAVCERRLPFRYQPADAVPVELRGAGQASRQVNNFCTPEAFEADALIACEVLTPGGNWSSYPPHKHDEATRRTRASSRRSTTSRSRTGRPARASAYQRVYGHPGKEIDVLAEVRTGDVVLIPYGWHGPSMAVPGYDLYYLNVMAGPGDERAWRICDDPAHAWIRETWATRTVDPTAAVRRPGRGCEGGRMTTRLTVAQAIVRFLEAQYVERDGVENAVLRRLLGHLRPRQRGRCRAGPARTRARGATTARPRPRAALPPGPQRAGDGARGRRLRPPPRPAGDLRRARRRSAPGRPTW